MKYQKGTFVIIPNVHALVGLSPFVLSVFFWICKHSDQNGRCFPSFNLLAKEGAMSRRQVIRSVLTLEKIGFLKKTSGKKHTSNRYQILLKGGDYQSLGGDSQSPGVVTGMHPNYIQLNNTNSFAKAKKNKDMAFKGYNENESVDDLPSVDLDSGNTIAPAAPKTSKGESYKKLIEWAEERRGMKFIPGTLLKQFRAFKSAGQVGLSVNDLKRRWENMEGKKFWEENGFDWMTVVNSFNKKPK